jgi:site-specific recombinase XerD
VTTISDALAAYRIFAAAEGKSPKTVRWTETSLGYFAAFLGTRQDIAQISGDDLRHFIIALRERHKFASHPFTRPMEATISLQSIETYARAVRAFFGFLQREGFIEKNPMEKVKMPKVPLKVVPTFSGSEIEKLLCQPNKQSNQGFRDYAILLTLIDSAARIGELASLKLEDVDLDNGYLKVMGKGGKERYIPFGHKVAKVLFKYKLIHRAQPVGTDNFWLTADGRTLTAARMEKIISAYGRQAGLKRCYPHKLRHTSSVLYLRNGGDPFSLQKKLGHSSLQMTRHYSNLADSDVRAQHLKFGVADKLKV